MDSKFKNIVLFLVSLCVIILFLLLIFNGSKKNNSSNIIQSNKNNYIVYKVDDLVKLIDNTEWYVLKNSSNEEKDVYLISKNRVNNEIEEDVDKFVKDKYLDILCTNLNISREQISDIRLLDNGDITDLYEIDFNSFNPVFDTNKFKLLENDTIVNYNLDNKRCSLCREGFCNNDNTDIRVVIKIAKYFVGEV